MEKEFIDLIVLNKDNKEIARLPYIYRIIIDKDDYCENVCIYGSTCYLKKSPIDPNKTLMKFCDSTSEGLGREGEDPILLQSTPGYGTVEGEIDYYHLAIKNERLDSIFCNSICEFKDPEYCDYCNGRCNLRDNIKIRELKIIR